jgi:hypothetical protein
MSSSHQHGEYSPLVGVGVASGQHGVGVPVSGDGLIGGSPSLNAPVVWGDGIRKKEHSAAVVWVILSLPSVCPSHAIVFSIYSSLSAICLLFENSNYCIVMMVMV